MYSLYGLITSLVHDLHMYVYRALSAAIVRILLSSLGLKYSSPQITILRCFDMLEYKPKRHVYVCGSVGQHFVCIQVQL